jgi:hypothetical protein
LAWHASFSAYPSFGGAHRAAGAASSGQVAEDSNYAPLTAVCERSALARLMLNGRSIKTTSSGLTMNDSIDTLSIARKLFVWALLYTICMVGSVDMILHG